MDNVTAIYIFNHQSADIQLLRKIKTHILFEASYSIADHRTRRIYQGFISLFKTTLHVILLRQFFYHNLKPSLVSFRYYSKKAFTPLWKSQVYKMQNTSIHWLQFII